MARITHSLTLALSCSLFLMPGCRSSGDSGGDPPDAGPVCDLVLDTDTLANVVLSGSWPGTVSQVHPGDSLDFYVGQWQCCNFLEEVAACVDWSVTGGAAQIDGSGRLTVDATEVDGTLLTITADIENGRRTLSRDVLVYTAAERPWVGSWREAMQRSCADGTEVTPEQSIEEVIVRANGETFVTWFPFETYIDYWANATFDNQLLTVELAVAGGNYVPEDIDGSGSFSMPDGDTLELRDMWLGAPSSGSVQHCGHRLTR